jgi:YHS domain-containing protein
MKSMLCTGLLALSLVGTLAFADDKKKDDKPTTKPVNKMCAVMSDHPVDERVTIQHDGKTIGFCCEDCIPTFKENPAKYVDKMK